MILPRAIRRNLHGLFLPTVCDVIDFYSHPALPLQLSFPGTIKSGEKPTRATVECTRTAPRLFEDSRDADTAIMQAAVATPVMMQAAFPDLVIMQVAVHAGNGNLDHY